MAKKLTQKIAELSPERQAKVRARADLLIAEESTLSDLRKALDLTQKQMAEFMGVGQEGISRLEHRSDLLLSTLNSYIDAMGGKLKLVAEFPNRPVVSLTGFGDIDENVPVNDGAGKNEVGA